MRSRFRNNLEPVWLIAWRELRDQLRDWRILLPIIGLTVFFPFLMNFAAKAALNFASRYGTPLIGERFVPFLLMVVGFFPITVSLVIALEAFVGEKERGTIEPLLSSPLKDWQLFLGKLIAAVGAPLATAYLGILVYLVGLYFQDVPLPDANRLVQTILLTTVQAFLMVSGAILISTQATSVRAANLMASFIVIPVGLLIQGESILMFWGNNQVLWFAVVGVGVLAALLIRVALAHFQRETLLGREIDVLNLRWMGRTFWKAFRGEARNLLEWYRKELAGTLRRQSTSIIIMLVIAIGTLALSYGWFSAHAADLVGSATPADVSASLGSGLELPGQALTYPFIFWHNVRAILLSALLGLFSFGVLGVLLFIVNIGMVGGVLGIFNTFGYSPWTLALYGLLPHGVFELTALILSSAAVLQIGITLVTPARQTSLGEALINSIADWTRINLGIVLPLLAIAAAVETWVTPVLLQSVLK